MTEQFFEIYVKGKKCGCFVEDLGDIWLKLRLVTGTGFQVRNFVKKKRVFENVWC